MDEPSDADYLLARHLRPMPRVLQGQALRDLATSAIDLSDGLISDLGHILKASGCGARIDLDAMPYSDAMLRQVDSGAGAALGARRRGRLRAVLYRTGAEPRGAGRGSGHLGARFTCIGQIAPESEGLQFIRDGKPVALI